MPSTIRLFGVQLTCWSCEDAVSAIIGAISRPRATPLVLIYVNVHTFRTVSKNRDLWENLQARALLLLEGVGLKAACVLTKGRAPADTNGTDVFPSFLNAVRGTPCRLFLLGGSPEDVAGAKRRIEQNWPHVEIVGCRDGYFAVDELLTLREQVRRASPTVLLIGMGSPRQEALALEFAQLSNLRAVWAVGGLFDRLSGRIARAPSLILRARLEWLFRIYVEPRRLAPRYLVAALWLVKSCICDWIS